MSPRIGPIGLLSALILAAPGLAGCIAPLWPADANAPVLGPSESIVYHSLGTNIDDVMPMADVPAGDGGLTLPDELVIEPGDYQFGGDVYRLEHDGLYRFLVPGKLAEQRIVWDGDPEAILSAVAWIYSHGNEDDGDDPERITELAKERKILATCGEISTWVTHLLGDLGIEARTVTTLTLEEWNSYDNGHTMIEVFHVDMGQWVLYDLDNNAYFLRDGKPLSLTGFVDAVAEDDFESVLLASDTQLSVPFEGGDGYDYTFYAEYVMSDDDRQRDWYARVIQVPLIRSGETYYFSNETGRERVESYSDRYVYLEAETWWTRFYPDETSGVAWTG